MKLVEFPEQHTVIAKNQPQYIPMPAHIGSGDTSGIVTCCWQLSFMERIKLIFTGKIWHQMRTFNKPVQPQKLLIDKPDLRSLFEQVCDAES